MVQKKRKITVFSEDLFFVKYEKDNIERAILYYRKQYPFSRIKSGEELVKMMEGSWELETESKKDEWISTAWSEGDFCIYGAGKENVDLVEKIYEAFKALDVIIYTGTKTPGNPFSGVGLIFQFESMMSEEEKQEFLDFDLNERKLEEKAEPIRNALKEAGKRYFACSPEWIDKEKETLKFFLNPHNQDECYWGWGFNC